MTDVHEEVAEHASTRITQWVVISSTAAEAMAQVASVLARQRAARDEEARAAARREVEAAQADARLQWEPMLDPKRRENSTLSETGVAWASAQAWKDRDPLAEEVSDLAEERLRDLRPDAMRHYDEARAEGVDPITAMRVAAPYFDDVMRYEREAVPDRVELERSGMALEAAADHPDASAASVPAHGPDGAPTARPETDSAPATDAAATADVAAVGGLQAAAAAADVQRDGQLASEHRLSSRVDDPTTPRVDEHVEGLDLAVGPRGQANLDGGKAEELRAAARQAKEAAAANPTAQTLAGVSYPQALNTTSAKAAAASTEGGSTLNTAQRSVIDEAHRALQKPTNQNLKGQTPKGGRTR